ncbi:hypothetical protein [Pukyongiella litopenaei]|uniref:Uncharacterized protein n=1 Tax=Pukyongiella litopenaei TaxID=2605946 RepID=A0A2S0MSA9_9RHOB|nr:hypothetical protein [Pukyongiella litopenaei]AVO38788.2 hypothetical protein C6Y53_14520 [Pukyongiella litopenaei]
MKSLQPVPALFKVAKAMLCDAWDMRLAEAQNTKSALLKQLKETERQIENLLDRIVDAANPSVVGA